MATMWPRRIPVAIRRNPLRAAECRVYDMLERALGSEWSVYYSRPWLGLTTTGEEVDGEADFVVAHASMGFLCIEVKGGHIAYDPELEVWTSTDRNRIVHKIKDPVAQAKECKHRILAALKDDASLPRRRIRMRHGVILSDTAIANRDFGLGRPRRIFADREQLIGSLSDWVVGRFETAEPDDREGAEGLGIDGMRALTRLLAEPFHLRVPLGHLLDDDDREIELLTERQFAVLSLVSQIPRVAISGGAGTGKTVLALEVARRASEAGERTLFSCFNRALATRLAAVAQSAFDVHTFHSLCGLMIRSAGIAVARDVSEHKLYEELMPELLVQAAERMPALKYKSIIIDEAQDFRPLWWPALDAILEPGGRLVAFHDSNQRIYENSGVLPKDISAIPVVLDRNLRSTDIIHRVAMEFYEGPPILPSGIAGSPVESRRAIGKAQMTRSLEAVIARLTGPERIAPHDIAVLAPTESLLAEVVPGGTIGGRPTTRCDLPSDERIVMDTVRRFKGLDARVVVILAGAELVGDLELAYVATSRARTCMIVIGEGTLLEAAQGVATAR